MDRLDRFVLIEIADYLTPRELVAFGAVCRLFNKIYKHDSLWQKFFWPWSLGGRMIRPYYIYAAIIAKWRIIIAEHSDEQLRMLKNDKISPYLPGTDILKLPNKIPRTWINYFYPRRFLHKKRKPRISRSNYPHEFYALLALHFTSLPIAKGRTILWPVFDWE